MPRERRFSPRLLQQANWASPCQADALREVSSVGGAGGDTLTLPDFAGPRVGMTAMLPFKPAGSIGVNSVQIQSVM